MNQPSKKWRQKFKKELKRIYKISIPEKTRNKYSTRGKSIQNEEVQFVYRRSRRWIWFDDEANRKAILSKFKQKGDNYTWNRLLLKYNVKAVRWLHGYSRQIIWKRTKKIG